MKTTEIIKKICYDTDIIRLGADVMTMSVTSDSRESLDYYCMGYFGTARREKDKFIPLKWDGERIPGKEYFYIYFSNEMMEYIYKLLGTPDAFCHRVDENDNVGLWLCE